MDDLFFHQKFRNHVNIIPAKLTSRTKALEPSAALPHTILYCDDHLRQNQSLCLAST